MSPTAKLRSRLSFAALLATVAILTAASTARADAAWPHEFTTSKGSTISIYEPRLETLEGNRLSGNAACSVRQGAGSEPIFGALWFTATVKTDAASGTVSLVSIDVTQTKFPDRSADLEKSLAAIVERDLPTSGLAWSADWMNEALRAGKAERAASAKINNDPPAIVVSTEPAALIQFDGEPRLRPIEDSSLSRVVNTPYLVVYDPAGKNYYLGSDPFWYQSKDPLGPWRVIANPPSKVLALKPEEASPADAPRGTVTGPPPKVIVATRPTELIVFEGEPEFSPVAETDLLHVTNSDKDVFKDVASQDYYVLLSGRWFTSASTRGPWTYVPPDRLPASFAAIPNGSDFAGVLASVPGTSQAEEAVLAAQVPKVAAVPRGRADFEVWYDDEPQFRRIKGTDIEYAVNTSTSVFKIEGKYYACDEGVWYVSDGPDGPWYVCDKRPEGLEAIPPDNPNYNTKYVYVYDSTPDVVYVGYTPGYLGCYPYHGAVYYGTGYWYDPWYGPAYYAYPWTWGFGAAYTPYWGWGFGFGFATGFVSYGMTWGGYYGWPYYGGYYGPYYGGYGYCGGWYGPGGYYPVYRPYAPYTSYGNTRTRTTVERPASIYDRQVTRYRKSASLDGASGKQLATRSGSRYSTPSRDRVAAPNQRYMVPDRSRSWARDRSRYAPDRGRAYVRDRAYGRDRGPYMIPDRGRYSVPNGRSQRPYGDSRYRDRSGSPRAENPGDRAYDRPWTGYRGSQLRGYSPQPRGQGGSYPQYRGTPGGQGRSSGGRGSSGGGGGGGRRR